MRLSLLGQIRYTELSDSFVIVSMVQLTLQFMETQLCLTFHSCDIVFPFLAAIYFFKPDYLVASIREHFTSAPVLSAYFCQ